jgi:hypothetical protein
MSLADIVDSTINIEPVGTWEVAPRPADGRLILHVNALHARHKAAPPSTTYHALLAKLDQHERPQAVTILPAKPDGDGFLLGPPPTDSDHAKAVVAQFTADCTLVPCELPASLD